MLANKECPFCKVLMRKQRLPYTKEYSIFCYRCKYNFVYLTNTASFNFLGCKIQVNNNNEIRIIFENEIKIIKGNFDVYNNISEIIDKITTVGIFR